MIVISLQSGSNGNCIYVEAGGKRLLFDAGISGIKAEERLKRFGRDIRHVDGLFLSHDHSDHASGAGVFNRKYGIPVYATEKTLDAAAKYCRLGRLIDARTFTSGTALDIAGVRIETLPTPHDAADGSVFVVESEGRRLGIMTDLGNVFGGLLDAVSSLDAVMIESNYDPRMLEYGPYPAMLKARIKGPGGHISNEESAGLVRDAAKKLRWACLSHLSEQNNTPKIALNTHREIQQGAITLITASRYEATQMPAIE